MGTGWGIALAWTAACTLAAAAALWLTPFIVKAIGIDEDRGFAYIFAAALAIFSTAAQVPALAGILKRPRGWWAAGIMSWAAGYLLVYLATLLLPAYLSGATFSIFPVLGGGIGLVQWLYLRRHVQGAGWFGAATFAGFALLGVLFGGVISELWGLVLIGLIPGLVSGAELGILVQGQRQAAGSAR